MSSKSNKKNIEEMSPDEIHEYHHTPETKLSLLVCTAAQTEEYASLKDYLQVLTDCDKSKINEKDRAGITALHCAVARASLPAVILLLKFGAMVDCQDKLGFTPLFLSTGRYPSAEIVTYLLENGRADVNMVTNTKATALHGASLQGNIDCMKILLDRGADPRAETEDGTTPFDIAKTDEIRKILHEAMIDRDDKKENEGAACCQCKEAPPGVLKRCSQCHVTLYCSRRCQVDHWKRGGHREKCQGFVLARPWKQAGQGKDGHQMSFYKVMGSNTPCIKVYSRSSSEATEKKDFLKNKRFVVKVQIPIGNGGDGEMMVYNADRSVEGFIYTSEKGYTQLTSKIRSDGFMGIKGFFWAEQGDHLDGSFKVFHGKVAPYQKW